ncbi:MAG: ATPase, T2SS/T4P/T4SS family, partial [Planctomycetota bacterium]
MSTPHATRRVGEVLLELGAITEPQLAAALDEQKNTGRRIGEVLVANGIVSPEMLVRAIGKTREVPGVRIRSGLIDTSLADLVDRGELERRRCIPLFRVRGVLTLAMADPTDLPTIDRIGEITGCTVRPALALESNIAEYLSRQNDAGADIDEFLTTLSEADLAYVDKEAIDEDEVATDLDRMVDGSPIVNLVNVAILTAIRDGASDIHVEPSEGGTRVRARVDGGLRDMMRPPLGMHAAVISRIKVIGKMDIAQKRLPQEGRVRIVAEGRGIDLRISSMPTLLGEKMVIRILDKQRLSVRLEDLGFGKDTLETFTAALAQPHGLVLVTGPTGSGKTTSLYSALDLLRGPQVNIVTVEDPVEYQLDLINQIQVQESIGMSFARALRSI